MNRPSFRSIDIWADCEKNILLVLSEALAMLRDITDTTKEEDAITVDLYKAISEVRFSREKFTLADWGVVMFQTQNQPINPTGVDENTASLRKKPDLQWAFFNESAETPEKQNRSFTIECKCLYEGTTSASGENYVKKGISRFVLAEWSYGNSEKSAAVIGYIKSGEACMHLSCINARNQKLGYPEIHKSRCYNENGTVKKYIQHFTIREFEPKAFTLHHLWTHIPSSADVT